MYTSLPFFALAASRLCGCILPGPYGLKFHKVNKTVVLLIYSWILDPLCEGAKYRGLTLGADRL